MKSSTDDDFHSEIAGTGALHPLTAAAKRASAPPPKPPDPIFQVRQQLARQSPQPDRRVAIEAAASPPFEAAMPLLQALGNVPAQLDVAQADALHRRLMGEVTSFQSVCQDARIRYEYIAGASYALCTALDESVGNALFDGGGAEEAGMNLWMARSLAVHFHGDSQGGVKVFRLIGWLALKPQADIDLLELMFVILRLGFEGAYRYGRNGRRELENMQYKIHSMVSTCRRNSTADLAAHWQRVEGFIDQANRAETSA